MNRGAEDAQGRESTLNVAQWWAQATIHSSKPSARTSPRVNPPGNHALWAMVMCQGRFMDVPL